MRHSDVSSSEQQQQQRRRHWDQQDVGHLLSVLDNAELSSSSCSASQTSCTASVSQTSYALDDDDDVDAAAAATQRLRDCQGVFTSNTHTPVYGPLSGTTQVSQYQKGKTNADVTEA